MTSNFLADLDAAVEQRCACLCGRPITGASPSAYFASEGCARRWHRPAADPFPVDAADAFRRLCDLLRDAFDALRRAMQQIVRTFIRVAEQLAQAGVLAQPTLPAPNRAVLPRPPRAIHPAGGLRSYALGRPVYRPAR